MGKNPLVDAILAEVTNSSAFRKLSNKLDTIPAEILEYDEETRKVSVKYHDPNTGEVIIIDNVDISRFGNMHSKIEVGDVAILVFPGSNVMTPMITSIIPPANYKIFIQGSTTLKSSGGI